MLVILFVIILVICFVSIIIFTHIGISMEKTSTEMVKGVVDKDNLTVYSNIGISSWGDGIAFVSIALGYYMGCVISKGMQLFSTYAF